MPPDISTILADLYALDPALKKHEAELTTLIQKLLLSKPDTKFDEAFARRLHNQLMTEQSVRSSMIQNYTGSMRKMMYTLFGSAAVVAAALLITIFTGKIAIPTNRLLSLSSPKQAEQSASHRLAANAFGSLLGGTAEDEKGMSAPAPTMAPVAGQAADTAPLATKMMAPAEGVAATAPGVASSAMIMRPYLPFAFVYKGDDLVLPDKTLDVYRRIKPTDGRPDLAAALSGVSIGGVNLGSFGGSNLTSFELRQPTSDGYTLSVQVSEGTMGISRTTPYSIMPVPMGDAEKTLSKEQIPDDSELIAIATAFLHNHSIDLSTYGSPMVQNEWRTVLPMAADTAVKTEAAVPAMLRIYYPQSITVLFPRKLNSETVYDQGGSANGISVNVNVQNKMVDSVWGIQTNDYESSAYEAVTNAQNILDVVERGGVYGEGHPTDAQVPVIEVGTPERVYMVYYKYDNNTNTELLVPALRFPITKIPDGTYYYQKSLVVPLVAELLKPNTSPGPILYMKGAAGVSGSGSAGSGAVMVTPPIAPQVAPTPSK